MDSPCILSTENIYVIQHLVRFRCSRWLIDPTLIRYVLLQHKSGLTLRTCKGYFGRISFYVTFSPTLRFHRDANPDSVDN